MYCAFVVALYGQNMCADSSGSTANCSRSSRRPALIVFCSSAGANEPSCAYHGRRGNSSALAVPCICGIAVNSSNNQCFLTTYFLLVLVVVFCHHHDAYYDDNMELDRKINLSIILTRVLLLVLQQNMKFELIS